MLNFIDIFSCMLKNSNYLIISISLLLMNLRNIVLWLFIALIVFGLFNLFSNTSGDRNTVDLTYSQFLDEVEARKTSK